MQHLHDDALTLLALGEEASDEECAHLDLCPRCRADLGSFQRVVAAARLAGAADNGSADGGAAANGDGAAPVPESSDRGEPATTHQAPDSSVWENIHRELELDEHLRPDPLATPVSSSPSPPTDLPSSKPGAPAGSSAPVASLSAARQRRRRGPWLAAAAAAVVVGAAGTWGALRAVDPNPGPEVIASVDLSPLASYSDTGSAVVDRLPNGQRELVVTSSSNAAQGYREVWLLAPDAGSMVSLGTMDGTEGHFVLPEDLDLSQYPVVDISDEPYDGDPAHSGDSILRGKLDL
ncbi:anti-sigma factor [Arthrobacter gengyunqii]|uniref:Anti-sigma factor n=1 Tax=Arthrobacter gengyunqii TaxID=2886940 RepID=A0ABS8GFK6_9MICC|nr:anti-sigma factor [Arthrobacter gengyunqii]MCC3265369.1 anti-sigma factor [Arthrobacter gengyunqii]